MKNLPQIDLTTFRQFHSLREVWGFKKIDSSTFEVKALVNWMKEEDLTVISTHFFCFTFTIENHPETKTHSIKVISGQVEQALGNHSTHNKVVYKKGGWWTLIFGNGQEITFFQSKYSREESVSQSEVQLRQGQITEFEGIDLAHVFNQYAYITFESYDEDSFDRQILTRDIKKIEFKQVSENGVMSQPEEVKTLNLDPSTEFFFDELTEEVRIFTFASEVDNGSQSTHILTIYNENLVATKKIRIRGFMFVYDFLVISPDELYIPYCPNFQESNEEEGKRSTLINLKTLNFVDFVDESDHPFLTTPIPFFEDRFLALTNRFSGYVSHAENGVYISDIVSP